MQDMWLYYNTVYETNLFSQNDTESCNKTHTDKNSAVYLVHCILLAYMSD